MVSKIGKDLVYRAVWGYLNTRYKIFFQGFTIIVKKSFPPNAFNLNYLICSDTL